MGVPSYPDGAMFVTGVAKTGKDDAINAVYQTFSLSLVIDVKSHQIFSLSCNMVMEDTINFVRHLLVGKHIVNDLAEMTDTIRTRFHALSQKALIAALHDAQNHYLMVNPSARPAKE